MSFIGPLLRPAIGKLGRYIYTGLRQQERLIDYTYRKTGLYNRGVVRGIKHGLAGGQIVGGGLSLGLNAPDSPGNDGSLPFSPRTKTYKQNQTRRGRTRRYSTRCYRNPKFNRSRSGSSFSKYNRSNYRFNR